jgi:hypothetical protein
MEIDKKIDKWFKDAKVKLSGEKTYYEQYELDIDSLCLGVVVLVENYVGGVLLLLNAGKILPAKALLRVIADVSIKSIWCLRGLEHSKDDFCERLEQWLRYSLSLDKQRIESEISILKKDYDDVNLNLIKKLETFVKVIEEEGIGDPNSEKLPSLWNMREIWKKQAEMNFDALYRRFNQGIHPDWMVLQYLRRKEGDKFFYKSDIEEKEQDLKKFCLLILGYLLEAIYSVNKWDFSDFEKDVNEIRNLNIN